MTPRRIRGLALRGALALVLVVALGFAGGVAYASTEPYETGPVIHPSDLFAPYTDVAEPYAPYEAGPVIHPSDLIAPYTPAGNPDTERIGNYLVR